MYDHLSRKLQWIRFSLKTPFTYLSTSSMTDIGVNFRDTCKRLWKVLVSAENPTFGGLNPVKCVYCREFTCPPTCIEERRGLKVTLDIGGKITKIIRGDFRQESHSTMVAIPKVLKCYDCDQTFSRDEVFGHGSGAPGGKIFKIFYYIDFPQIFNMLSILWSNWARKPVAFSGTFGYGMNRIFF